jgi:hypothetical protein
MYSLFAVSIIFFLLYKFLLQQSKNASTIKDKSEDLEIEMESVRSDKEIKY